jgi:hypothetical protein
VTLKGIEIENLAAFRKALRLADGATPRELSKAIRKAGQPIVKRAGQLAPRVSGQLARSYTVRASGTTGKLYSRAPYGPGAEWGLHGKWKGFRRYRAVGVGGRGRFALRAVVEREDETASIITDELREILTLHGWASP